MARILYADDDADLRELFERILPRLGHNIVTVPDAVHAWAQLDAGQQFDCVISDLEMPKMDGLSFLRKVRGDPRTKNIPFVLISGHDNLCGRPLKDICEKDGAVFFDKWGLSIRETIGPFLESIGPAHAG